MTDLFRFKKTRYNKKLQQLQQQQQQQYLNIKPQDYSFFQNLIDGPTSLVHFAKQSTLQLKNKPTSLSKKTQIYKTDTEINKHQNIFVLDQQQSQTVYQQSKTKKTTFAQLGLLKPLLKGIQQLGYSYATPIQKLAIPAIMSGKDVFGTAQTGTGKTAAFLLPILQRFYRCQLVNYIRILIVIPTRQLAIQCYDMLQKLSKYAKIQCVLVLGASKLKQQQYQLRQCPTLVIGTPGRLVDHIINSKSVSFQQTEILIFDQADKLLQQGFQKEIRQIIQSTGPKSQTIMFSATIGSSLQKIIQLSMRKPIRIAADPDHSTAKKLVQKIVRLRQDQQTLRQAALLTLVRGIKQQKAIVFFRTKVETHRFATIMNLLNLSPSQLHGNMSQTQRITAFDNYRNGQSNILLATDLAARGLDINDVRYVINYQLPYQLTRYIHRVGRTARAGKKGVSITICNDRQALRLKKMLRKTGDKVVRVGMTLHHITSNKKLIDDIEIKINKIKRQQREEMDIRKTQMQIKRFQNLQQHFGQIRNRPKRTWVCNQKQKRRIKQASKKKAQQGDVSN